MRKGFVKTMEAAVILLAAASTAQAQLETDQDKGLTITFTSPAIVIAGDATLTEADLQAHVESIPPADRAGFVNSPRRIAETAEQQTRQEQLAQEALESDLLDDPVRSARLYRAAVDQLATWQIQQVLADRKLDDYEQQARELYLSNPERFRKEASYSFTHLLIASADRTEEAAMRKVLSMVDELGEGADFEELVASHSDDGTVDENGGRYQSVPPDRLDGNFADALQELSPGEVSGPVRSRFGWHLIRLDEVHEGAVKNWEEARSDAVQLAEQRHAKRIREAYMQELSQTDGLEIAPDLVKRLQDQYGPQEETPASQP